MTKNKAPKLRTVNKFAAAYPLNDLPKSFAFRFGEEVVCLKAAKGRPELEGIEGEQIFAECIGATWKHSNIGLDDVTYGNTAYGVKTLKSNKPASQRRVRLISGRNSPSYSFGVRCDQKTSPTKIGELVLKIWNERVAAVCKKFEHLRTVVMLKSSDLSEVAVFELETIPYDHESYRWKWNKNGNLVGTSKKTGEHCFTWQPHGSQFTIIREVPSKRLVVKIKHPKKMEKKQVLKAVGYSKSWVTPTVARC